MSRDRPRNRSLPVAPPRSRWTPDLLAAIAEGERRALRSHFDHGEQGLIDAAAAASDRAAELQRASLASEPPLTPVACQKGCAACCVSKVVVVAAEVIRIADHLRRTLDPDALAALVARVRAADEQTRGLTRRERAIAAVPCPLLVDDACSVHEVRPLLCRGWTSLDVSACAQHFADPAHAPVPPAHAPSYELASAVLAGLGRAAIDAGLDGSLLEFVAALRIALERENAAARWRARLPVFSTARDTESPPGE
ncbi:MAG: YkgJ family cysteine cluster protein [Minicystis sp.]